MPVLLNTASDGILECLRVFSPAEFSCVPCMVLAFIGFRALMDGAWLVQGSVVWEGTVEEFDTCEVPIVRQFASGSLDGPIRYE